MKRNILWLGLLALVLMLGISPSIPTLRAQAQAQQPAQQPAEPSQKANSFVGMVVKTQAGRYALLTDKQKGTGFYLDNEDKAKQFEGKTVRVLGTLDVATSTIHVSDIQPA